MSTKILGIDVGSIQVCAVLIQHDDNDLKIIGMGTAKTQGIKKGAITNIELASKSIKAALNDAQRVAGTYYEKVVVSISGINTRSVESSGVVNIPGGEIGIKEINRSMLEAERQAQIHNDHEKLHVLPYNFKVDDQEHIEDPLGMNGNRLEVQTHIITAQKSAITNLKKALNLAGVEANNVVLCSYASAISTLTQDEKDLGVVLIDMGGATCNMVVWLENTIRHNSFLGVGSSNITFDLSSALHTPLIKAEEIKLGYGNLLNKTSELVEIPSIDDEGKVKEISLDIISHALYSRVEETLMVLAKMLDDSGYKGSVSAGVVLTGGMAKVDGIRELASVIFDNAPVRIAKPREMEGLYETMRDPINSCAIGLCMYGAGYFTPYEIDSEKKMRYKGEEVSGGKNLKNIISNELPNIKQEIPMASKGSEIKDIDLKIGNKKNIRDELANIADISKEKQESWVSKTWHKMTQLF